MRAGKLRHQVTFLKPADVPNDATDYPGQWLAVATVDADIRPLSVKEIEAGQGLLMQTDRAVEVRWREDLALMDNHWRAQSPTFTREARIITADNPDCRKRALRVVCREQNQEDSP